MASLVVESSFTVSIAPFVVKPALVRLKVTTFLNQKNHLHDLIGPICVGVNGDMKGKPVWGKVKHSLQKQV
jgi:hypothetical protein